MKFSHEVLVSLFMSTLDYYVRPLTDTQRHAPPYRWNDVPTTNLSYVIPDPVVKLLEPKGFSITVRADKGIMEMMVYGGLNDELKLSPHRPYNCSIRGRFKKANGSFVYCNREVRLKDGDVCVYHLIAAKDYYLGFCGKYGLRFTVNIYKNKKYRIFHDLDDGADTT